ncbi:MAG TPA: hypothetical protein VGN72_03205 [Tepidisphaeraceae bacterium]|jgi:hypothetical protein|nr:hypothetical protein [Tepidisphaeraceae bacterium]
MNKQIQLTFVCAALIGFLTAWTAIAAARKGTMPLPVFEDDLVDAPYVWSGWMGDGASVAMDDKDSANPHSGNTSMKCEFKSPSGFGGIVAQSPINDWGDVDGGVDLTGAKKLTFWARGAEGGEVVSFGFGYIGKDKPFHDTANAELKDQQLEKDWKQYAIDLEGKDLTRIKTGFGWVVAGQGKPVIFFLDDIRYE